MSNFNINKVDFFNFDLEKYLEWLEGEYSKLTMLKYLPKIDKIEIDYRVRKFSAFSHYLQTRGEKLPNWLEDLYQEKINHFKRQSNELKDVLHYVIYFDSCIGLDSVPNEAKKYIQYSKEQVENFDFKDTHFIFWKNHLDSWQDDFIDEFNNDLEKIPLTEKKVIKKKINEIKSNDFNFVEYICNGRFVPNLDTFNQCFNFFLEVAELNKIRYLEIRLKGKTPNLPLLKPVNWNGNLNALATIFNELKENEIIDTQTENLKRLILNNFTFENKKISKTSLDSIFNKSKGKFSSKTIEAIQPLLQYLTENRP